MVLVKILKRKDATSVIVAVVIASVLTQLVNSLTARWAVSLSGLPSDQSTSYYTPNGMDWKSHYLYPLIWAALQLIALEVLAWVYVWGTAAVKKK